MVRRARNRILCFQGTMDARVMVGQIIRGLLSYEGGQRL